MKSRKILLYLLVGIVVGFVICTLLGAIISHYDPDTLTEDPKIFGDAKIYAFTSDTVWGPDEEHSDIGKVLLIKRNDASLFYAKTDKDGKITNIIITAEDNSVRLSMLLKSGKWRAIYCNDDNQIKITTGEQYIDLNFDGQFDVKALYNEDGERLSRHIYIGDGLWKEAQHIDGGQMAAVDEEFYVFSDDFGWQLSEP